MASGLLYIAAFAMLVFRSGGRQMRMMTSAVLLSQILFLAVASLGYTGLRHYPSMDGGSFMNGAVYASLLSVFTILAVLLQMYAVSVMARVDDTVQKENFVMIQLWLTSSLISSSVGVASGMGVDPLGMLNGVFGIMAAVSWKRIARTRLFAGKGQTFETVSYSPLNRFMVGPFVCAAVIVLPVIIITSLM